MGKSLSQEWLSLSEAAEILGVHPSTVRLWANKGDLTAHRTPGQHRRFRRTDVEAWAGVQRAAQARPGELIIQNALGRTRMQVAEGQLGEADWYQKMPEPRRREFRELSRRLLGGLLQYMSGATQAALSEAAALGNEYERLGRLSELSLGQTVKLFLFFRDFLFDSVLDLHESAGPHAPSDWTHLHRQITGFTNAVLLALIDAQAAPSSVYHTR